MYFKFFNRKNDTQVQIRSAVTFISNGGLSKWD